MDPSRVRQHAEVSEPLGKLASGIPTCTAFGGRLRLHTHAPMPSFFVTGPYVYTSGSLAKAAAFFRAA